MHIIHINRMNLHPTILRHMIQIINGSTHGISMTRVINRTFAQVDRLFDVGSTSRHGPEKEGVDFDDLLDCSGGDVGSHRRTRIDAHDDAAVKFERERGSPLGELHSLILIGITARRGEVVAAEVRGIRDSGDVEGGRVEIERGGVEASRSNGAGGGIVFGRAYGEDIVRDGEVSAEHGVWSGGVLRWYNTDYGSINRGSTVKA
eukprot:CCRYP_006331-RC/>CCRYP_006331-RC protein AED:0.46 eAED:0.87 QI:0/0/0/1/0/0/2/0/203